MIRVLFFAQFREQLNCEKLEWSFNENMTAQSLLSELQQRGEPWQSCLSQPLLVAVNQNMVSLSTSLQDDDEIAFFPPVTGG